MVWKNITKCKLLASFCWNVWGLSGAQPVDLVDLVKSFHVPFLNLLFELDSYSNKYIIVKSASIQPRTSRSKFADTYIPPHQGHKYRSGNWAGICRDVVTWGCDLDCQMRRAIGEILKSITVFAVLSVFRFPVLRACCVRSRLCFYLTFILPLG